MKIGVISDLHLCINRIYTTENYIKFGFIKQLEDLDILFICGDTSGSFTLVIDFMNWLKNFIISNGYKTKVYFTIGNHEGYEYDAEKIDKTTGCLKLYEQFSDGPVQFLENKSVQIGEYIIFGACLYTDFNLYGKQECSRSTALKCINDFKYVYDYDENCDITPIQSTSYITKFKNTVSNLQNICEENRDKKILVFTHFCPSEECISGEYIGNYLNPFYASHLDQFIIDNDNIKLWGCGHCVDDDTEILTVNGWKNFKDIQNEKYVLNLNKNTGFIEKDCINYITEKIYTGDVFHFNSPAIDVRVTKDHIMLDKRGTKNIKFKEITAEQYANNKYKIFIKAGIEKKPGLDISDDLLRLLVWISADGSINKTYCTRFRLKKERKIRDLEELLLKLNIEYRKYEYKNGMVSINFALPMELKKYNFKPIDKSILKCDKRQCSIIINEYGKTDGTILKNGGVRIYTSKKEEADYLQEMCITNGFTCNINIRKNHGFKKKDCSEKISYDIYVKDRMYKKVDDRYKHYEKQFVEKEHFWCINTNNNTIITRRNGKVSIIGNCHHPLDINIEQCKLVMNPYGYFGYEQNLTPREYKCKIVEI